MHHTRHASAQWEGTLKEGGGSLKLGSGVYEGPYTWAGRFADGPGTNPEELVAAAHAGCFTMALSAQLGESNLVPQSLTTEATLTFDDFTVV